MTTRRSLLLASAALLLPKSVYAAWSQIMAASNANPWPAQDGSLNAPSGTVQFATLLNGYPTSAPPNARTKWPSNGTQPPWSVPGVDYYVGIDRTLYPTNANLKDPATISGTGLSVNTTTHTVTVTGSNITLDGYDYSLAGGWIVEINGGTNITLSNSNWQVGSNSNLPIYIIGGSSGIVVKNCIIDGNSHTDSLNDCAILIEATETPPTTVITVNYCYFLNLTADFIDQFGGSSTTNGVAIIRYNAFYNAGTNASTHPDWYQTLQGQITEVIEFNLFYQPATTTYGPRGIMIGGDMANSWNTVGSNSCSNNVLIALGTGTVSNYMLSVTVTGPTFNAGNQCLTGTCAVQQNYTDGTGCSVAADLITMYGGGSGNYGSLGNVSYSGNVSMLDGSTINYAQT